MNSHSKILLGLLLAACAVKAQRQPVPYAPIANPLPPTGVDQRIRDSLTLQPSRVRVNQAGYRTSEVRDGMARFYFVGEGLVFSVIDTQTRTTVGTGVLTDRGFQSGTSIRVRASNWAGRVANGDTRYIMSTDDFGTTIPLSGVREGVLPTTLQEGRHYRVVVGSDTSSAFFVSDAVYGMVRDAVLKFFGIQRSGPGPSWFHGPCHTRDGAVEGLSGAFAGGWHDCGDHLKEPITMSFALATLGALHATMIDRDADHYGLNHNNTLRTDGVPDVLAEARFGAEFFLRSWIQNGRRTQGMVTGVGLFGIDHGWWGRPENQDVMEETGRGGWRERALHRIMGQGSIANQAAGLAFLSRAYRPYDPQWADTALMAARDMYAFARANEIAYTGVAPYGQGIDKSKANLALAAIALLWATREPVFLQDLAYDRTLGPHGGDPFFVNSVFDGGWLAASNKFFYHARGTANFDWANIHPLVLYAFHRLILVNPDSARAYGVRSEDERVLLGRRVINNLIGGLQSISREGVQIDLPGPGDGGGASMFLRYDPQWFRMHVQQEWVWNRYYIANAAELFFYKDVAQDFADGRYGVQFTATDWRVRDVRQLMIRILDYQLGVNPWDVSMIMGIGEKNFNHPHHRAANPEGRNTPGSSYPYRVPVGALYGGRVPETPVYNDFWSDYHFTEVCTDGGVVSLAAVMGLARAVDRTAPPRIEFRVLWTSDTSAILEVNLSRFGSTSILIGTDSTAPNRTLRSDSNGVSHRFHVRGLTPATRYFIDVIGQDIHGNADTARRWPQPAPDGTRFSLLTDATGQGRARIENVTVCNVTADTAEITWYTPNGEYNSSICWGRSPVQDASWQCAHNIGESGIPTRFHRVKIGGLIEQTDYWFRVGSDGVWDDNAGAYYTFRTPVRMADFDVFAVRYAVGGMPALAINVVNNEPRGYDSLTLRVYIRSRDTLALAGHFIGQPPRSVPVRFADAVHVRYDICQAYNAAGFNLPCSDTSWGGRDWGALGAAVQLLPPVKMPETFDPTDSTYVFYFNLPLGPTRMVQGSRIRFDVIFANKQVDAKVLTDAQRIGLDWVRGFIPEMPSMPDTGWFEQGPTGPERWLQNFSDDWSFHPHRIEEGAPVDFPGIPVVASQAEADALIDGMSTEVPENPYMTVYRKGEFVYGFSPSHLEQATKRTYWGITTAFVPPFNLSDTAIVLDQSQSTVRLRGTADVYDLLTPQAKGAVTEIWVNGQEMTSAQLAQAAVWNPVTRLWDLNIPVTLTQGTNLIDVTIFGGVAQCPDTAVTCPGGCAFFNKSWTVQFSRGDYVDAALVLRDSAGVVYAPAQYAGQHRFRVVVEDANANNSRTAIDRIPVLVWNPVRGDTLRLSLVETGVSTGVFQSSLVLPVDRSAAATGTSEIALTNRDTVWVRYIDPEDELDTASSFFTGIPRWPLNPQVTSATLLADCDSVLTLRIPFSTAFAQDASDRLWSAPSTLLVTLRQAGQHLRDTVVAVAGVRWVGDTLVAILGRGESRTDLTARVRFESRYQDQDSASYDIVATDATGPRLLSATLVQNTQPGTTPDTLRITTSERVAIALSGWPFDGTRAGLSVSRAVQDPEDSLAWTLIVTGNNSGQLVVTDQIRFRPSGPVRDLATNAPSACANSVRVQQAIRRPVSLQATLLTDCDSVLTLRIPFSTAFARVDSDSLWSAPTTLLVTLRQAGLNVRDTVVAVAGARWAGDTLVAILGRGESRTDLTARVRFEARFRDLDSASYDIVATDVTGPRLLSAAIVENFQPGTTPDTLRITTSERVTLPTTAWPFDGTRAGLSVSSAVQNPVDPLAWTLIVTGNTSGQLVATDLVRLLPSGPVRDLSNNAPSACANSVRVQTIVRPVPLVSSSIHDTDGDGAADAVRFSWARALRPVEVPDSLRVTFGNQTRRATVWSTTDSVNWTTTFSPMERGVTVGLGEHGSGRIIAIGGTGQTRFESSAASADSVGPVLRSAVLRYGLPGAPDTLELVVSEDVRTRVGTALVVRQSVGEPGVSDRSVLGSGMVWRLPVDTSSAGYVWPGDSVRLPTSGSRFSDVLGTVPGLRNPWVVVRGGDRPPHAAWALDVDGDGRVETFELRWGRTLTTHPSLMLRWPDGRGGLDSARRDSGTWSTGPDGLSARVSVPPFAANVTGAGGLAVWGTQVSGGVPSVFAIADSVAPVLVSARVRYASEEGLPDTLETRFSEAVVLRDGRYVWRRDVGGITHAVQGAGWTIGADSLSATLLLDGTSTVLQRGDSARLAPRSSGSAMDFWGNAAEEPGRWIAVQFGRRPPRWGVVFEPRMLVHDGWPISSSADPLRILVRAQGATTWQELDGGILSEDTAQLIGPVLSLNTHLDGYAMLYDNLGTFVASADLGRVGRAFASASLPTDPSDRYQVWLAWNGRSEARDVVASGIYIMRLFSHRLLPADDRDPERVLKDNTIFNLGWKREP